MDQHVDHFADLRTHPVLRPMTLLLTALILAFLGLAAVTPSADLPFALLVAAVGPWGLVSGIYFDGMHSDDPLPATHVTFMLALFSGVYALFITTAILDLTAAGATDAVRATLGFGTLVVVTAGLYWWSHGALEQAD